MIFITDHTSSYVKNENIKFISGIALSNIDNMFCWVIKYTCTCRLNYSLQCNFAILEENRPA